MIPTTIRKRFFSVLAETEKDISSFVNNPGADMTRHRYCDFKDTILATLTCTMNRSNTELLNYFGVTNPHIPSKSAFTQQRKKFNSLLFPHLLESFNNSVPFKKEFHGFHLVAVDGSDINLPVDKNDTVYRVKQARSDNYYYQMHINALFDICENRYISASIQPRSKMNEKEAFCKLAAECSMPENTIFIADRGYVSTNMLANLLEMNKYFLIRVKSPASDSSLARDLLESDTEADKICSVAVSRSRRAFRGVMSDKYICMDRKRKFDFIAADDRRSVYSMSLRFTCVKLGENSYEYLVSNIPMDIFSPQELKELYWKRWSIETSFRRLKYALSLAYLHSVNRELIIQEIYAKMIMYNFASLLHTYAQNCRELLERNRSNKYVYKISFDDAVPIARQLLKQYIKNSIIKTLLLKHLTAVKKSEVRIRHMRSQTVNPLNNRA